MMSYPIEWFHECQGGEKVRFYWVDRSVPYASACIGHIYVGKVARYGGQNGLPHFRGLAHLQTLPEAWRGFLTKNVCNFKVTHVNLKKSKKVRKQSIFGIGIRNTDWLGLMHSSRKICWPLSLQIYGQMLGRRYRLTQFCSVFTSIGRSCFVCPGIPLHFIFT